MKAIVYTQYGGPEVLRLEEVAQPTPKPDQVLIKVQAASINAADKLFLKGDSALVRLMAGGIQRPKNTILGSDVAGVVEAVGSAVTRFKAGDAVFGELTSTGLGGLAEYAVAAEDSLALKPAALSFEQAAALPVAGTTALQAIRDHAQVKAGQQVLIYGASGGVGAYLVQIAKSFGAAVTAVCSTRKIERVRALGADHIIDYTQEDFTQRPHRYDVILAANGYQPITVYRRMLKPNGTYVSVGGTMTQIFQGLLLGPLLSLGGGKTLMAFTANGTAADLTDLAERVQAGQLRPIIDHHYPLGEAADAFRYLVAGQAAGKVVIRV